MDRIPEAFLSAVRAGLRGGTPEDPDLGAEEWRAFVLLSRRQQLLPLTLDTVCRLPSYRNADREERRAWQEEAVAAAARQIRQENEFLTLMLDLRKEGVRPAVVKGAPVRALYPKGFLRPSVDDDLLIRPEEMPACDRLLRGAGLAPDDPAADPSRSEELSYHRPESPLYIELHASLFGTGQEVFADWNAPFDGLWDRMGLADVQDVTLTVPDDTDHLLYLILHAAKHFLYSGFGIRPLCDIALFAEAYGEKIDWERLQRGLSACRTETFAAALFACAKEHLGFDPEKARLPEALSGKGMDTVHLLSDMLEAGALGAADEDRLHAASLTLSAARADRSGKKDRGLLRTLFPERKALEARYPYLKKSGLLLPAAWVHRLARYGLRRLKKGDVSASGSLKLGRSRVELLREYGLIRK